MLTLPCPPPPTPQITFHSITVHKAALVVELLKLCLDKIGRPEHNINLVRLRRSFHPSLNITLPQSAAFPPTLNITLA